MERVEGLDSVAGLLYPSLPKVTNNPLQRGDRSMERGQLAWSQGLELPSEHVNAAGSPSRQQRFPFAGGVDPGQAAVAGVHLASDEPPRFEGAHETCHRRWAHLFRGRELAKREWACKDQHGEGGEPGRGEPTRIILPAEAAQQVDRRRMQPVGDQLRRLGVRPACVASRHTT